MKVVTPLRGNPEQVRVIRLVFFMPIYKKKGIKIMETIVNYCLENPYILENLLTEVSYPTLCDRVYEFTNGEGLDQWLEEEATPSNFLQLQRLVRTIKSIMARKCHSSNNILYFPNERSDHMVA